MCIANYTGPTRFNLGTSQVNQSMHSHWGVDTPPQLPLEIIEVLKFETKESWN